MNFANDFDDIKLDEFQNQAIEYITKNENVIVSAPTSSGKTLCAIYGIYHHLQQNPTKKIIYTSPIKSLSNQKYYEFTKKFKKYGVKVGLITGDIKFNLDANILIMTAEILRNQLYKHRNTIQTLDLNINIDRDISCVIMDEVHYICDRYRGNIWEETLMLLPNHINLILLSATLDQAEIFVEWLNNIKCTNAIKNDENITKISDNTTTMNNNTINDNTNNTTTINNNTTNNITIKNNENKNDENKNNKNDNICSQKCHLIEKKERIIPLNHYAYFAQPNINKLQNQITHRHERQHYEIECLLRLSDRLVPIKLHDEKLNLHNYNDIKRLCSYYSHANSIVHCVNSLCTFLKKKDMLPCLFFIFSRKNIEYLSSNINQIFNTKVEQSTVHKLVHNYVHKLKNKHLYLKSYHFIELLQLWEKGIAYHHAGLQTVYKEIIELLCGERLIKVLFATETFSVGINAPIKTVIFTGLQKYTSEHNKFRFLHSTEYLQMCGRAGRRNLDTVGHVILLTNLMKLPPDYTIHKIMTGIYSPKSFCPNQLYYNHQVSKSGQSNTFCSNFKFTYQLILKIMLTDHLNFNDIIRKTFRNSALQQQQNIVNNLKKTMVDVNDHDKYWCIINDQDQYILDYDCDSDAEVDFFYNVLSQEQQDFIHHIESIKKFHEDHELYNYNYIQKQKLLQMMQEALEYFKIKPMISFLIDNKYIEEVQKSNDNIIADDANNTQKSNNNDDNAQKNNNNINADDSNNAQNNDHTIVAEHENNVQNNNHAVTTTNNDNNSHNGNNAQNINHIITNNTIITQYKPTIKGIIASNINEINEILLTEIVTDTIFDDELTPPELCAILSVFLTSSNRNYKIEELKDIVVPDFLKYALWKIIQLSHDLDEKERKYTIQCTNGNNWRINLDFVECVYLWASKKHISEIKLDVYLGTFVKEMLRLDNIITTLEGIYSLINKPTLAAKFASLHQLIIRDQVTNESLYIML